MLHVGVGLVLVAHGCRKLFGGFGEALTGTATDFAAIGFSYSTVNALRAGLPEAGGDALLAAGGSSRRSRLLPRSARCSWPVRSRRGILRSQRWLRAPGRLRPSGVSGRCGRPR
ncbi:DoxX family protein [Rhodococcus opacus]|uniref:DoxX family protein n=1 Tax=Rhodococcus opacus TaxID=37919 RepID=UPI003D0F93F2